MENLLPNLVEIGEKKMLGKRLRMSLQRNLTGQLWGSFMPRRKEVAHALDHYLYSLQVYGPNYFSSFNPAEEFDKWALVEVPDFDQVPEGLEPFTLPGGLYAVFLHRGASSDTRIFEYIFSTWLPQSAYELDQRPHFERLGEKYINNDPRSEEEIWVPVRPRQGG